MAGGLTVSELATRARHLVRAARTASLATMMGASAEPYASLVVAACDLGGAPILLLSDLAEHSQNLIADNHASLLFAAVEDLSNPLTGDRVSLQGRIEKSEHPGHRQRYLDRHADAEEYVDFGDFAIYHLQVERVHLVAGFGVIRWLSAKDYMFPISKELADLDFAASVIGHMNEDHADALDLIAADGKTGWQVTGLDAEGIDLGREGMSRRIDFPKPIRGADEVRQAVVALTQAARGP